VGVVMSAFRSIGCLCGVLPSCLVQGQSNLKAVSVPAIGDAFLMSVACLQPTAPAHPTVSAF